MAFEEGYPTFFESWWLEQANQALAHKQGYPDLQKLEPIISRISDVFTWLREEDISENYRDPLQVVAYGLFFFPQTFCRFSFPIHELVERHQWMPPTDRPLRILDLGCGSGAATFSCIHQLTQYFPGISLSCVGVDQSSENIKFARSLGDSWTQNHATANVQLKWIRQNITGSGFSWERSPFNQPWDFILMSFSFSEFVTGLEPDDIHTALFELGNALGDKGICLLTEPALQETSILVETLRDAVASSDFFTVLAPCLHQTPCPALTGKTFWCHEVRKWKPPQTLATLNTRLHRDIRFLKFSFLSFQRGVLSQSQKESPESFRLVSPVSKKAGQLVCKGCAADGRINTYEWLTRHLEKNQIKNQLGLERGDQVTFRSLKKLNTEHRYRVVPG
ncbi:MAG: small ribosomal subunit Rsm22 family protein [Verrucomicrobiota bacterium]